MDGYDELEDPFDLHFKDDLSPELLSAVSDKKFEVNKQSWPTLRQIVSKTLKICESSNKICKTVDEKSPDFVKLPGPLQNVKSKDLNSYHIKSQIVANVESCNLTYAGESKLTPLQLEIFSIIHEYRDLYFTERSFDNAEQIRFVYCLHAINHALKTRLKITHHNARISDKSEISDEFRDQGLVRPKVLIVVPFKDSALRVIKIIASILLGDEKQNIVHKKRFYDEFGGDHISMSQKQQKPEDFEKTFSGNIDDEFRIGIGVTKKSLKLYSEFYSSDIIVASPLGLRLIIGVEGEAERDYDFLSSIEVLILDQTEIFLMQNWDHVLHLVEHLNLQPRESHGTDFSRVRSWALNGWTKYYRQNLIFTANPVVDISALANKICCNYAGYVRTNNPVAVGTISQVVVSVPQIFYRLIDRSASETAEERFDMFVRRILPQFQDNLMKHVLIYVPSYFDFVRLRNYFKSEAISCALVCEYSKDRKVAEARDQFFHNELNFMLYSERFHFYRRRKIRGICHILFYQLPTFPHFYSELCNLMQIQQLPQYLRWNKFRNPTIFLFYHPNVQHSIKHLPVFVIPTLSTANQNPKTSRNTNSSVSVIYSKFDTPQLAAIVSTNRAARMLSSDQEVHMFMTDDIN